MATTSVVHIRKENAFYIGRKKGHANHYGNPFSHLTLPNAIKVSSREASITAFREWLEGLEKWSHVEQKRRTWILANMHEFKGQKLGCFCAPKSCHGDVYVSMLHDHN